MVFGKVHSIFTWTNHRVCSGAGCTLCIHSYHSCCSALRLYEGKPQNRIQLDFQKHKVTSGVLQTHFRPYSSGSDMMQSNGSETNRQPTAEIGSRSPQVPDIGSGSPQEWPLLTENEIQTIREAVKGDSVTGYNKHSEYSYELKLELGRPIDAARGLEGRMCIEIAKFYDRI